MGQTRNTEVFCYFAEDTVEEDILKLAAQQGLSIYTKNQLSGSVDATALVTAKPVIDFGGGKRQRVTQLKGDFVANADDLLFIMFPHLFQPPNSNPLGEADSHVLGGNAGVERQAGPSRGMT